MADAWIVGTGSRAPIGLSSFQVAMMARADKLEPRALTHIVDKKKHEVAMAVMPGIRLEVRGLSRLLALCGPALVEALASVHGDLVQPDAQVPVVLALPDQERIDASEEHGGLPELLASTFNLPIAVDASRVIRCGHAGAAHAVEVALELLESHAMVAVGGVDSYYGEQTLAWLDASFRLESPSTYNGFIPSEGAAVAILSRKKTATARGRVVHVGTAREDAEVNTAHAATELMTAALQKSGFGWMMSDINGEEHRVHEATLVAIRHQFRDGVDHEYMPTVLGDIGAASGAMYMNIATEYWRRGCAPDARVAIALHSDGPERGLVILEAP